MIGSGSEAGEMIWWTSQMTYRERTYLLHKKVEHSLLQ